MKLVKENNNKILEDNKVSDKEAEEAIIKLLHWMGEDPAREGLLETPKRVVKAYKEFFSGYKEYFSSKSLRTSYGANHWNGACCIYTK